MNLYEITKEHLAILERAEELFSSENVEAGELETVQQALDLNADNFKSKALAYMQFSKNLESDIAGLDAEIKRLQGLKKQKTSLIDNLQNRLSNAMSSLGLDKVDLNLFKLSFRKSKATDTKELESKINEIDTYIYHDKEYNNFLEKMYVNYPETEYCNIKVTVSPNKTLIKKTIDDGHEVYGSKIVENKSLVIK